MKPKRRLLRTLNLSAPLTATWARSFNLASQHIADLYLTLLGTYATDGISKILIQLLDAAGPPSEQRLGDVLIVQREFDFAAYDASEEPVKRQLTLDVMHSSLLETAAKHGWPREPLEDAYAAARARHIRNCRAWRAPINNPSNSMKAQIEYDFGAAVLEGYVRFTSPDGRLLGQRHLFSLPPVDFELDDALGTFTWESEHTVALKARTGQRMWKTSFER